MRKIEQNEQWLLSGNCDLCSRRPSCVKSCTSKKEKDNVERIVVLSEKAILTIDNILKMKGVDNKNEK